MEVGVRDGLMRRAQPIEKPTEPLVPRIASVPLGERLGAAVADVPLNPTPGGFTHRLADARQSRLILSQQTRCAFRGAEIAGEPHLILSQQTRCAFRGAESAGEPRCSGDVRISLGRNLCEVVERHAYLVVDHHGPH